MCRWIKSGAKMGMPFGVAALSLAVMTNYGLKLYGEQKGSKAEEK